MRSVFVCFFLNYSELRKCSFIPFSQWTKGYISVCPLLRPFFFLNWLHSLALSSYDITYIFCLAWFSLSSFWSFFSLGNLCQNLLDFLTSLISFKLVLSKHLALDTPIHAFKARCTDSVRKVIYQNPTAGETSASTGHLDTSASGEVLLKQEGPRNTHKHNNTGD